MQLSTHTAFIAYIDQVSAHAIYSACVGPESDIIVSWTPAKICLLLYSYECEEWSFSLPWLNGIQNWTTTHAVQIYDNNYIIIVMPKCQ